ncbi:MAG: MBL fold metallo-hydrolase [Wenzhouxiangellaceae bacterium]
MATELFNNGQHICMMFSDLVEEDAEAVQANQFLIANNGELALLDPGGNMTYNRLFMAKQRYFPQARLKYVLASHADPDIIASLGKWLVQSDATLMISRIWHRFVPHFCPKQQTSGRIQPIPDQGMDIPLGNTTIKAVPAHFLHSEGNFQFYDATSKILFSGDMGASMSADAASGQPVDNMQQHLETMRGFHQRYMSGNKVCRLWANMVKDLDMDWLIPQHGRPFKGRKHINEFLHWVEQLECGIDLMTQSNYQIP